MEKKKKAVILAALIIVMLIVWMPSGGRRKRAAAPGPARPAPASLKQAIFAATPAQKRTEFANWGRNPFVWPKLALSPISDLELSGIIWDKDNPYAIINGAVVHSGDIIEGKTVGRIESDQVILRDDLKEYILRLAE